MTNRLDTGTVFDTGTTSSTSTDLAIEVSGLGFARPDRRHRLEDIDFRVRTGQVACLLGPNGSGKSTLLRCVLGLLPPTAGQVRIAGRDLGRLTARARAELVAYVPQSTSTAFPFTALDIAVMGRTPYLGPARAPGRADRRAALAVLDDLGIAALADQSFASLSGGQRAMTLLARALVQQSRFLILDEPTAALDLGNATTVLRIVADLARQGRTVLMTTHQPEHALWIGDHVVLLADGRVLDSGDPAGTLTTARLSRMYGVSVAVGSTTIPGRPDPVPSCVPDFCTTPGPARPEQEGSTTMCTCCTPPPPPADGDGHVPEITAFPDRAALLAAVKPGMELCTSDFRTWATIDSVESGCHDCAATVIGTRIDDGRRVRVPATVLVDILDGTRVRVDRVHATIGRQGWEQ